MAKPTTAAASVPDSGDAAAAVPDIPATVADVLSPLSHVVGLLEVAAAQGLG